MMGSLKDVAKLAGVSVSTVSYVINGKKTVRPETYKKIMDAIKEVDYHPNIAARSLKINKTKSIGIVVADFTNIFYIDVLTGIESELAKEGYSAIVSNSRNDPKIEEENLREIVNRNVDGIILLGTDGDRYKQIEALSIPVISVDRVDQDYGFTVSIDNVMGGYIGANFLLQKGCKNLAFIGFDRKISVRDRLQGCRQAMKEYGLSVDKDLIYLETEISPKGGYEATLRLFSYRGGKICDGIFANSDYMAFGVIRALADLGYRVPEDVAIVGFDDITLASYCIPALTTIAQPRNQMGVEATKMLMKILNKEEVEPHVVLEPKLVMRESV